MDLGEKNLNCPGVLVLESNLQKCVLLLVFVLFHGHYVKLGSELDEYFEDLVVIFLDHLYDDKFFLSLFWFGWVLEIFRDEVGLVFVEDGLDVDKVNEDDIYFFE